MKTRKLFIVLVLVVVLLAGTVLVANAAKKIRVTGGMNNTYFGMGWEWMNLNVSIDPVTGEAEGMIHYKVYAGDENPKFWESWTGEPVCGSLGEYNSLPTIALVIKITEVENIPESWVGNYMKITLTDGGQNASEDIIGIVVWDFATNNPVDFMPSCDFELPLIPELMMYPSQNGNITIHD